MKKVILALFSLALVALSSAVSSAPINMRLLVHNQVSTSTVSRLVWKTCDPPVPPAVDYSSPCINPDNPWVIDKEVTGSTATWTWDPDTKVLASSGLFWTTSYITSNPQGFAVISDRVENLAIDLTNAVTTATKYDCVEGNFLAGVNANGCGGYDFGNNGVDDSSTQWNVVSEATAPNPDPYCVVRTIGGDDVAAPTDTSRGVTDTFGLTFGCDDTGGAFTMWTLVYDETVTADDPATDGQLRISTETPIGAAGSNWMTFEVGPTAVADTANATLTGTTPIAVMANDIAYTDNVTVTVPLKGQPQGPTKGTAVVSGSPGPQAGITIGYTPDVGVSGTDSFVYTAVDADGVTTSSATVTITILTSGANPDSATTTRNKPIGINVGANDVGFASPVTITIIGAPDQGGTSTPPASGPPAGQVISYTPATTAQGAAPYTETFTYQITDGTVTGSALVTVTVNNTQVVAGDTGVTISTAGTAPGTVTSTFNAGAAPNSLGNQPSTVTATAGAKGTTSIPAGGSAITYTPATTFFEGTDTYTYTITDSDPGTPETATGTVTVTIPDVAPTIADGTITTTAGAVSSPVSLVFTAGNGSTAQNPRTLSAQATGGSCALSATQTSVTYTPNAGFTGTDSCVVTITDGDGETDTGRLTITVNAAGGGGGGGGTGPQLPPASGSLDLWSLSLLAGLSWLRLRHRGRARGSAHG